MIVHDSNYNSQKQKIFIINEGHTFMNQFSKKTKHNQQESISE